MTAAGDPRIDEVRRRHGSAKRPDRPPAHETPDGVDDATVEAVGKLTAALETAEVSRGFLYAFHRFSGTADREVQEAVDALRKAGREDLADAVDEVLVGRDTIDGMWSFQLVERFDAEYMDAFKDVEGAVRRATGLPEPHVHEAGMKYREQQ